MIVIGEGFFWFPDGFVLTDGKSVNNPKTSSQIIFVRILSVAVLAAAAT